MKIIQLLPFVFLFAMPLLAQNGADSSVGKREQTSDVNETVLKYEQFLREETKLHREYTQEYYSLILKLLAGITVVAGGILTWMNWKTKEGIKKQVNDQFNESIQDLLNEKLKQVDQLIKEGKEKSATQFSEINKLLLELSLKSEDFKSLTGLNLGEGDQFDVTKLKGKKILWVDDKPANNEYPMKILRQAGTVFDLARNTKSAMELLRTNKYDLVISDMGRGDNKTAGLDFLRKIKEEKFRVPVIFSCSVNAIKNFGDEALKLGAVAINSSISGTLNAIQKILSS